MQKKSKLSVHGNVTICTLRPSFSSLQDLSSCTLSFLNCRKISLRVKKTAPKKCFIADTVGNHRIVLQIPLRRNLNMHCKLGKNKDRGAECMFVFRSNSTNMTLLKSKAMLQQISWRHAGFIFSITCQKFRMHESNCFCKRIMNQVVTIAHI